MISFLQRMAWPILMVVFVAALAVGTFTSSDTGPRTQQDRIDNLAGQIRCPTCAGLSVGQSEAPLAQSAKEVIVSQVSAGRTDAEIKAYFVGTYGDTALMSPARNGVALTAWLLPAFTGALLVVLVIFAISKWTSSKTIRPTEADRDRVARALGQS